MTDDKTSILCELIGHSWCSSLGCDVCHVCGAVQKVTSPNYTVIKLPMRSEGVKMGNEGPYKHYQYIAPYGKCVPLKCPACAFSEGRKSMEKEIEEKKAIKDALLCGTGFVMEGKRVPPEDVYLSETEIKLQKVEKDFRELLELKNKLSGATGGYTFQGAVTELRKWKKARGIE